MYWVHHRKRRYYRVHIATDLFDELTVITCWGSLDSHRGGYRTVRLTSHEELHRKLRAIAARRRQHGYERLH